MKLFLLLIFGFFALIGILFTAFMAYWYLEALYYERRRRRAMSNPQSDFDRGFREGYDRGFHEAQSSYEP